MVGKGTNSDSCQNSIGVSGQIHEMLLSQNFAERSQDSIFILVLDIFGKRKYIGGKEGEFWSMTSTPITHSYCLRFSYSYHHFPEMNGKIPKYVLRIDAKHKDNWKLIVDNLHLMTVLPGMETVWVLVRGSHLFQVVCTCFQILPPTCCHHVLQFILAIFAYQTRP